MFSLNKDLQKASLEIKKIYEKNINGRVQYPFQGEEINKEVRQIVNDVITFHDPEFNYTVLNWLNEDEIKYLQNIFEERYSEFVPNYGDHYSHQINELRINTFDEILYQKIGQKFFLDLEWILAQIYDHWLEDFDSIHLTRYNHKEIKTNAWHVDGNSDITAITLLSNDYIGGELNLSSSGVFGKVKTFDYKDFPVGSTHFFKGKSIHKGGDVIDGTKKMMVIWASKKQNDPTFKSHLENIIRRDIK